MRCQVVVVSTGARVPPQMLAANRRDASTTGAEFATTECTAARQAAAHQRHSELIISITTGERLVRELRVQVEKLRRRSAEERASLDDAREERRDLDAQVLGRRQQLERLNQDIMLAQRQKHGHTALSGLQQGAANGETISGLERLCAELRVQLQMATAAGDQSKALVLELQNASAAAKAFRAAENTRNNDAFAALAEESQQYQIASEAKLSQHDAVVDELRMLLAKKTSAIDALEQQCTELQEQLKLGNSQQLAREQEAAAGLKAELLAVRAQLAKAPTERIVEVEVEKLVPSITQQACVCYRLLSSLGARCSYKFVPVETACCVTHMVAVPVR